MSGGRTLENHPWQGRNTLLRSNYDKKRRYEVRTTDGEYVGKYQSIKHLIAALDLPHDEKYISKRIYERKTISKKYLVKILYK